MAQTVKLKRSAVAVKVPLTTDLALGELAVNTNDGVLYTLMNDGTNKIVQLGGQAVSATVTAGTNAQGQGPLTSNLNVVNTTTANPSGVTLPTALLGKSVYVFNRGTNPINVYPATGAQIDALGTNVSFQIAVGGWLQFNATSLTQWYSSVNASSTTVSDDTTTNATYYPVFSTVTSGAATLKVNSTGFNFNPFSSSLSLTAPSGNPTFKLFNNTNSAPTVSLELQRGTNSVWGADAFSDYRLSATTSGQLALEHGLSGVTTERIRLLDTGRILLGGTTELTMAGGILPRVQVSGSSFSNTSIGCHRFSADTSSGVIYMSKSRNATIGGHTLVNGGDTLGLMNFAGSDGTQYLNGVTLTASAEGTPTASSVPGRFTISTTPEGASIPIERIRFRSDGGVGIGGVGSNNNALSLLREAATPNYTTLNISNLIGKEVNGSLISYISFPNFEAAPFSLPLVFHYAAGQTALSSGPIIDIQHGFNAYSFLTGGDTNRGFFSNLAAPVTGPFGPFTVSTISSSGTTVTVNTTVSHALVNGQTVSVSALANATALVSGVSCTITTVGTTDFTLIGAASNTVGLSFVATGAGTGSGTVTLNCQGGGLTVAGSSGTSFTYIATASATFANVTIVTGTVVVSRRHNFYAAGTADNYFAGDTGFGVVNPTQKIDVVGSGLFRAATNQDGVLISGRAGGTSSFNLILTPATLSANQTLTLPNVTGTVVTTGDTGSVTSAMIATETIANTDVSLTAAIAGTKIAPNFGTQNIVTSGLISGYLTPTAGTATAGTAPLKFTSGTNLTTPEDGAVEYDGTYLYVTPTQASGRGHSGVFQTFRLTANGSALGPAIADYFGANSSINLAAGSVYEIEYFAYFQKLTAGTLTWTHTASSAPTLISSLHRAGPVTGIAAGAPTTLYTGSRATTTAVFGATASVSNNAFMAYEFQTRVITNLATNFRLRVTSSAGTVTPQAGSFYTVRQVSGTTGSFAA